MNRCLAIAVVAATSTAVACEDKDEAEDAFSSATNDAGRVAEQEPACLPVHSCVCDPGCPDRFGGTFDENCAYACVEACSALERGETRYRAQELSFCVGCTQYGIEPPCEIPAWTPLCERAPACRRVAETCAAAGSVTVLDDAGKQVDDLPLLACARMAAWAREEECTREEEECVALCSSLLASVTNTSGTCSDAGLPDAPPTAVDAGAPDAD